MSILFLLLYHVTVAKPSIHGNDEIEMKSTFIHNFSSRNVKFESLIIDDVRKEILISNLYKIFSLTFSSSKINFKYRQRKEMIKIPVLIIRRKKEKFVPNASWKKLRRLF